MKKIIVLGFFLVLLIENGFSDSEKKKKVIYPKKTKLTFEGTEIDGELKNSGEFYFQYRKEDKMDSLVKRRAHFHREILRDVVLSQ